MIRSTMRLSVALLVVLAALPLAAQTKVAVIDVQRVVTESDPGKEALGELKGLQDQKLEQGRVIQQELDALREQYTKQRNLLDPEKAEQLNKQIEDKAIALRRFQDDAQRELEEARRKALDRLETRIMPIIETIGQEQGLTLIFNKFQSGLVFADESVDITDDVIRRFNTIQ